MSADVATGLPGDGDAFPAKLYVLNGAAGPPATPPPHFKSLAKFCAEYLPLTYIVEPIIRSGSLYTLTAKTGAGKTLWLVNVALALATGRSDILQLDVERGRVAYLVFENPDDVRMRFKIVAFHLNIDLDEIGDDVVILDVRRSPEDIVMELAYLSEHKPFVFIAIDTFAAFFGGKDINDNVQAGEFTRRLRPMTRLKGLPSVIVAAHPTKSASEEQLVPYGGGAILNEVDGNFSLWKRDDTHTISLHWQGKLRGLDFPPVLYRIETVGSPDVLDKKGAQVKLPVLRPIKASDVEARQSKEVSVDIALLRAMLAEPKATSQHWANVIGRSPSNVSNRLKHMERDRLVSKALGLWSVTKKGQTSLENCVQAPLNSKC